MRRLGILATALLVFTLSTSSGKNEEKAGDGKDRKELSNADKIVGSWEGTKGKTKGIVLKFTKDGKAATVPPGDEPGLKGTYSVEGDTLEITFKGKDRPAKLKIKSLNETILILVDEKGSESEFKKK